MGVRVFMSDGGFCYLIFSEFRPGFEIESRLLSAFPASPHFYEFLLPPCITYFFCLMFTTARGP
jgi:hypothetical protein